ncbi:MAG: autoinducer binding domain-containing protein [Paracoccaceae bacterium]|jgi:hypothetical protein
MQTENHAAVADLREQLAQICDTGYALALHIRFTRPTILFRTYAEAWLTEYSERGLMLRDPVVIWGMTHSGYVYWDTLDDPEQVLAGAARHGILNGLTCSVGPAASRSISGFSRSSGPFSAEEAGYLLELTQKLHDLTAAET